MSLNANALPLVKDFLEVTAQLGPLQDKAEILKTQLRTLGAGSYALPGVGVVKVSVGSESKLKGTQFVLTDKLTDLSPKERAKLQDKGVIRLENIFSRASASKVEAILA